MQNNQNNDISVPDILGEKGVANMKANKIPQKMGVLMSGLIGGIAGGIEISCNYPIHYIKTVI